MKTHHMLLEITRITAPLALTALLTGCLGSEPEGIAPAQTAATTVKMDFFHKPLPVIPLPNDIATRYDPTSATGRRINASMVANTRYETNVRKHIDQLDGWGLFQPITIPFTGPLDVASILAGHRDADYDLENDVVYLINVDPDSRERGRIHYLDLGNGNYPVVLEDRNRYWKNDEHEFALSLLFEESDEDVNGNGKLDPGEDIDADGVLDRPNYLPGKHPALDDLAGRADALMTFYEAQTNTLIARPLMPLRERTTYAVVVTRRLKDANGRPVGSPFPYINHVSQNEDLADLARLLPRGTSLDDVAFAYTFTTQSVQSPMVAVRDGLYGFGIQAHLGQNYPAEVAGLERLKDADYFKNMKNPYLLYSEQFLDAYDLIAQQLLDQKPGSHFYTETREAQKFVDYHVIGSFKSPQLFRRTDEQGNPLGLNDQSWPPDLDRVVAPAREETVYFWLVVPRKEVSVRGEGKPAPVVVLSHGYTSSRFEALAFGAYLARFGLATLSIDCVSHGLELSDFEQKLAEAITSQYGVSNLLKAIVKGRAADLNGDGRNDSGGDFWTAYLFHTRDVVRQSALDYMQLLRIFRTFDGTKTWKVDINRDGKQNDIAGDFDGDGKVDVGGPTGKYHMTGGSLGGIMSLLMGGIEPTLTSIAPISGAAGLGEVAIRSRQGGVPEPVWLRTMGPLFVGTLDSGTGATKVQTVVVDVNGKEELDLGTVGGVKVGDTVVGENLENGQVGCSYVSRQGTFRLGLESDLHDRVRLLFYEGDVLDGEDCRRRERVRPRVVLDTFEQDVEFQAQTYARGSPLLALAEGQGLRRNDPELRRFSALTQLILDPGDPVSYARNYQTEPLVYGTGERTGTHTLMVPTIGDMNVPVSTGVTAARAAGLVDFLDVDPRYGKSVNQVLIDTHTLEATDKLKRYTDSEGHAVLMDVDNLSGGKDRFGERVPRLKQPLRVGLGQQDALGGASAMLFPLTEATGTHGFSMPGEMADKARKDCEKACQDQSGADPCGCATRQYFDVGRYMFGVIGRYFLGDARRIELKDCMGTGTCTDLPGVPKLRDTASLP